MDEECYEFLRLGMGLIISENDLQPYPIRCGIIFTMAKETTTQTQEARIVIVIVAIVATVVWINRKKVKQINK